MIAERELHFSMKCIKLMLVVANCMFVLVGFLLLSIGLTVKAIYSDLDHFLLDHYYDASKLAIALGIIIFVVSFFGCIGAIKQSVCLINVYALFLFLILIMEVAVSIVAYTMRHDLRRTVRNEMTDSMHFYNSFTGYVWNSTQYNLNCCGVYGPDDWAKYDGIFDLVKIPIYEEVVTHSETSASTTTYYSEAYTVPRTCCRNEICYNQYSVYTDGCLDGILFIVNECALLLGIGAVCIAFIQVLGIIFANLLARSVRRLKTQIEVARSEMRQHIYEQLAEAATINQKVSPVLYIPSSSEA